MNTSFDVIRQIDAGVLNVGYAEAGSPDGPAVILLHGWPTTSTPMSMSRPCWHRRAAGDRAVSARLRHNALSFSETVRNGQQSVVAVDIIALMDALNKQGHHRRL